jgi:hypothetical protein
MEAMERSAGAANVLVVIIFPLLDTFMLKLSCKGGMIRGPTRANALRSTTVASQPRSARLTDRAGLTTASYCGSDRE